MTKDKEPKSTRQAFYCPCCGYRGLGQHAYQELHPPPYRDLADPPDTLRAGDHSQEGCHCCGYEFGYADNIGACGQAISLGDCRKLWIEDGCRWFHGDDPRPKNWSIAAQLAAAGIPFEGGDTPDSRT